jgi:O-methyltransferase
MRLGLFKNIQTPQAKTKQVTLTNTKDEWHLQKFANAAYSTLDTIQNTYDMTKHVLTNNIPGVIVECGVAAGAQIGVMHQCCLDNNKRIPIYAFDSYEGIPLASKDDDEQPGIGPDFQRVDYDDPRELLVSSGITVHSLENTSGNIKLWFPSTHTDFNYVKGWFQDTVSSFNKPISVLRLDGDLYESTKVCLEALYPLLSTGGVLIIDDWALTGCRKACEEYFATCSVHRIPVQESSDPAYFIKIL